MTELTKAQQVFSIYYPRHHFPEWVLDKTEWDSFHFADTIVFYHNYDDFKDVKKLITEREPCNIGMGRMYDIAKMQSTFGWSYGAYQLSTKEKLMPNIAVYCHSTFHYNNKKMHIHVINLIGYAFDSTTQPDYIYFKSNYPNKQNMKKALVQKYHEMWKLALACLIEKKLTKFRIYCIGGGAFASLLFDKYTFVTEIFEPSFCPLLKTFEELNITILGYNFDKKMFNGGFIPTIFNDDSEDLTNTLYCNAWDPWTIIGNGNECDRSLDGFWGRYSNLSVLGWYPTNPAMKFVSVLSAK